MSVWNEIFSQSAFHWSEVGGTKIEKYDVTNVCAPIQIEQILNKILGTVGGLFGHWRIKFWSNPTHSPDDAH